MSRRVIIIPACGRGEGIGHLKRSIALAKDLGRNACILVSGPTAPDTIVGDFPKNRLLDHPGDPAQWKYAVLDKRKTSLQEILPFMEANVPLIGIDEGGESRPYCTFLIDILPFPAAHPANISSPGFLPLPGYSPMKGGGINRVLITYGGEDPAGLTGKTADFLIHEGYFAPEQITAVIGPFFEALTLPAGVASLSSSESLYPLFRENDLVFTSFGITPYEAAFSGIPVLLLNPTEYHRTCALLAGFPEIGVKHIDKRKIGKFLDDPDLLRTLSTVPLPETTLSLAEFLTAGSFNDGSRCPACGAGENKAVGRFPEKSVFSCSECGATYAVPFTGPEEYGTSYFFSDYKDQYGKTYLEDYPHLLELAKGRLDRILALLKRDEETEAPDVLDIGCAFGPFLEAARDAGCNPWGIDVSREAVDWVSSNLGLPAEAAAFETFHSEEAFGRKKYDIITMWFVIEHLKDLQAAMKKIQSLLKPGGVFAFSTPNLNGISGRKNYQGFLKASPVDHITLWDPGWARTFLHHCGFAVKKTVVSGHHPERFPGMNGNTRGFRFKLFHGLSRIFRLGDTFEIYGVKQ